MTTLLLVMVDIKLPMWKLYVLQNKQCVLMGTADITYVYSIQHVVWHGIKCIHTVYS